MGTCGLCPDSARRQTVLREMRRRAADVLGSTRQIMLSTWGPADVQVETLSCEAVGLSLYVLIPRTSDLLFNLENHSIVVMSTDTWRARGEARLLAPGSHPRQLELAGRPEAALCRVAEIRPTQLQMRPVGGVGAGETIDTF